MVEVTKSNFEEMIPQIEKAVKNCSFIALDTEFTGLDLGSGDQIRLFDTLEKRYQKLKSRASNFVPCQIGLSTFTRSLNENSYVVETYVFFVRPCMCGSSDRRFMFQASALDFLSCYDFDFNKFIKEGIPYLNETEEQLMKKELAEGTIGFCHEKLLDIRSKRERDMVINNIIMKTTSSVQQVCKSTEETRFVFPLDKICHSYFQVNELRRKYPSLWIYATEDSIIIDAVSLPQRKKLEKIIKSEEKKVLDYFLGFTRIFRIVKKAQKPIVGHNLLMDLLLFFHNFHRPLPSKYKDFKEELHRVFPVIFDTRYIWLNIKKVCKLKEIPKQSALFDLYEMFKNPTDEISTIFSPVIKHCNSDKYLTGEFPHESGYDSFVTGWVFLKICHLLVMKKITNPVLIQPQSFKQHLNAISSFSNKLNIGRSRERYINLSGKDPLPQVSEFLYITSKNSKFVLNQNDLCRIFDKYPMVELKLNRSRTGAIMAVGNIRSFEEILKDFKDNPDFVVTKYSFLKHSSIVKTTLWSTVVGCGCVAAFFVFKTCLQ